jgi:hypothetical protein
VPNPDLDGEQDKRFELYLKQFHPVCPEPLKVDSQSRAGWRGIAFVAWGAAGVVVLVALLLALRSRYEGARLSSESSYASAERSEIRQPLTIGSANALFARSSSVREALDQVVLHSRSIQLDKGKRSALAVLSENKEKL